MRWHHLDLQVSLEVGHVLSKVHERRLTNDASTPKALIDRPQHEMIMRPAQSCPGDHLLQFGLVDHERLAHQAQAAALVQQNKSWPVGVVDVDDQRQFTSPRGRCTFGAFRESFADVRIQNERIPWR
jgi:hypothetical protein